MDGYSKKKYVCKLLFIFLLGHDIDFGHMEAVNLLSSNKYTEKQIVSTCGEMDLCWVQFTVFSKVWYNETLKTPFIFALSRPSSATPYMAQGAKLRSVIFPVIYSSVPKAIAKFPANCYLMYLSYSYPDKYVSAGLPVHLSFGKQQQRADSSDQQCHQEWSLQPQSHLHVPGTSLYSKCGKPRDGWGVCWWNPPNLSGRVSFQVTKAYNE